MACLTALLGCAITPAVTADSGNESEDNARGFGTRDEGPVELFVTHLKFQNAAGRDVPFDKTVQVALLVRGRPNENDGEQQPGTPGSPSPTDSPSSSRRELRPDGWQILHRRTARPRADGALYTPVADRAKWPTGVDQRRAHALDAMALPSTLVGSVGRIIFALASSDATQHVLGSLDFRIHADFLANNPSREKVYRFHVPFGQSGTSALWTPATLATGEAHICLTPPALSRLSKAKRRYAARRAEKDLEVFRPAGQGVVNLNVKGELRSQRSDDYMRNYLPLTFHILRDLHATGTLSDAPLPLPDEPGTPPSTHRRALQRSKSAGLLLARASPVTSPGQLNVEIPDSGTSTDDDDSNAELEASTPQQRTPGGRSRRSSSHTAEPSRLSRSESAPPTSEGLDFTHLTPNGDATPKSVRSPAFADARSSEAFIKFGRPSASDGRRTRFSRSASKSRGSGRTAALDV